MTKCFLAAPALVTGSSKELQSLQKQFTRSPFASLRSAAFIWRPKNGLPAPCCLRECLPRGPPAPTSLRKAPFHFDEVSKSPAIADGGSGEEGPGPLPRARVRAAFAGCTGFQERGRGSCHLRQNASQHQVPTALWTALPSPPTSPRMNCTIHQ